MQGSRGDITVDEVRKLMEAARSNAAAALAAGREATMLDDHPLRGSHQADRNLSPDGGAGFLIMARAADVQQGAAVNLDRLASGGTLTCLDCGKAIPLKRLKAVPMTEHCVECKERSEHPEGNGHLRRRR